MLLERMIRAARLDSTLYDEVKRDATATTQALQVALIVAIAWGVGNVAGDVFAGIPGQAARDLIIGISGGVAGWVVWSLIVYWVGTTLMGATTTPGEMLRAIGFAYIPNVLSIFKFIVIVGPLLGGIAAVWSLIAGAVAIRKSLGLDTGKAIVTAVLSWTGMLMVVLVLGAVLLSA